MYNNNFYYFIILLTVNHQTPGKFGSFITIYDIKLIKDTLEIKR